MSLMTLNSGVHAQDGARGLPTGGMPASQGTFSSIWSTFGCHDVLIQVGKNTLVSSAKKSH